MSIRRLFPLADRVLIERALPAKASVGGIVLPESAREKVNWGTVIEVGKGRRDDSGKPVPMVVQKGDKVLLSDWAGSKVKMDDKELLLCREEEILGIVEIEEK